MKTILFIHHGKGIGGAPLSLLYLVENLDRSLYRPIVLFLHHSEAFDLFKAKGVEVAGPVNISDFSHTKIWWYRIYHPHHLLRAISGTLDTIAAVAPYWYDKLKPDIVHLNTSSLLGFAIAAHKKNIPVVWHVREPLADGYLGLRRKLVQKCVERLAGRILPICKNDAKPWEGNQKVRVVYNAVDSKLFDSRIEPFKHEKFKPGEFKILFLGGLSLEKGTLLIFRAFRQLLTVLPNAKLVVAGYFDRSTKSPLHPSYHLPSYDYKKELLSELEFMGNSVIFLGSIKNVPEVMAACDVVVFPALVGHFARPVIEAGFMKKPTVASKLPPLDELILDGKSGFLVSPDDVYEWSSKLLKLADEPALAGRMGEAAQKFCKNKFDLKKQIALVQGVYKELLVG